MKFSLYSSWNICREKKVKEKYQTCCIVSTSRHLLGISYGGPMTVRILLCWWRCHSCLLRISSQVRLTLSFLEGPSPFLPSCCWIWLVLARGRLRPIWMGDIWVVFGSSNLLREQITVQMDNVASCSSKSASLKNGINIYLNFIRTVPNDNLNGLFRTYSQQFYKEQCTTAASY